MRTILPSPEEAKHLPMLAVTSGLSQPVRKCSLLSHAGGAVKRRRLNSQHSLELQVADVPLEPTPNRRSEHR